MTMRIAMISEHASPLAGLGGADGGGQNVYVAQVARHLARCGHRVEVLTRRDDPELPTVMEWLDGVRIIHVPAGPPQHRPKEELLPFMEEFAFHALRHARRVGYDLVHAHFFMSALVATELKRVLGLPFVVTFHALGRVRRLHQGGADTFPEERLAIEDRAIALADCVIAECPQDKDDLLQLYNADPERIRVIPCGFDPEEFGPSDKLRARAALGLAPEEWIILQLGRMVPRKGVDNVIRAVAALRRHHELHSHLLVVGGESREPDPAVTPEIGRLRDIARAEGVADRVSFTGCRGRSELRTFYTAADVFVTTPWYEPFGITPVEAMACGTPVIGSAVGGIQTTVRDGVTGYLVPPKDPTALADRLAHLLRHPALLQEFSRQSVRRARALFTWQRVSAALESLYAEVLGRPARRVTAASTPPPPGIDSLREPGSRHTVTAPQTPVRAGGRPAVFLDKDGTLIEDVPYNVDPENIRLSPGAAEGLLALHESGYQLVVVSNQSGVARGHFPEAALVEVERSLRRLLAEFGVPLAGFYYCPHHPDGTVAPYAVACRCRKPAPGLLRRAADDLGIDLAESWMIGDILDDIEAGRRAGCQTVLLDNGNETEWRGGRRRRPHHVAVDLAQAARLILSTAAPAAIGGRS
jgi:histidinol-phosphate phosphatase family protein